VSLVEDPYLVSLGARQAWHQTVADAGMPGLPPPDPVAAFGYQQGIAPALPDGSYVVAPQSLFGGPSGVDGTWITNAFTQASQYTGGGDGALVRLMPLTYLVAPSTLIMDANYKQFLLGPGDSAAILSVVGSSAGPGITIKNSAGSYNGNSQRAGLRNVRIDGTSAPSGSTGIQAGDSGRMMMENVSATAFTGSGAYGFHFINLAYQTEQLTGTIYAAGNATQVAFDVNGGTASFDRPDLTCYIDMQSGQNGVSLLGSATGAAIVDGRLQIFGNSTATSANSVLTLSGTNSVMTFLQLNIGVENDLSTAGATTITFGSGNNGITGCWGAMHFLAATGAFTSSSLAGGVFRYQGSISGDSSLGATPFPGVVSVSDPGNGGIFATTQYGAVTVTPAAARTGMILATRTAGQAGSTFTIINLSGANSITFAASGTSNVADGVSDVIAANTAATYWWSGSLWYRS
jgi:hypothetical protein